MSTGDPNERRIFEHSRRLGDRAARSRYLDEACGEDAALRKRLSGLLAAYDAGAGFLEQPAVEPPLASTVSAPAAELGGTMVGRYKLLEQIGAGGMGAVWMADQERPVRRRVALKIIKPGMDSAQVLARFEAERQALALMDHPHIARVLDAGTTDQGRPFFVMELVKGVSITRYCDQQQLTPRQRLELFIPVCQAIQHAHQKGIIHRDIKPSNVLVASYDGQPVPKVIDFGVAKAIGQQLTERTLFTGFGGIVGTLEYMSPEQAEFNALDIDTRSDIYSLGVLLYELLTGSTPLTGRRLQEAGIAEALRVIREEDPPRPSTRLSTSESLPSLSAQRKTDSRALARLVRGELDWIVMRALEKSRGRRYETANSLALDVQRFLADEPVEACPPSAGYRLRKLARKHKRVLLSTAALLLVLALGSIISTALAVRANRLRNDALAAQTGEREQRETAEAERNRAVIAERRARAEALRADAKASEAQRNLYVAHIHLARQDWEQGAGGAARELLQRYAPDSDGTDLRGWEWRYQQLLCDQSLRIFRGHQGRVNAAVFSPDGKRLATAGNDGDVKLWDAGTSKLLLSLQHNDKPVTFVAFSPDGTKLATAGEDFKVRAWDTVTGALLCVQTEGTTAVRALAFNGDGTFLGSLSQPGEVRIWNAADWKTVRSLFRRDEHDPQFPDVGVTRATFGNDLGLITTTGLGGDLSICKLSDDECAQTHLVSSSDGYFTSLTFSDDNQWLAASMDNMPIRLWDLSATPPRLRTCAEPIRKPLCLAFSPDPARVAAAEGSGVISLWDVRDGILLRRFFGHEGEVRHVAFNFDGTRLASAGADGTARVWDMAQSARRPIRQTEFRSVDLGAMPGRGAFTGGIVHQSWRISGNFESNRESSVGLGAVVLDEIHPSRHATISPDGRTIGIISDDDEFSLWDAQTGLPLEAFSSKAPTSHRCIAIACPSNGNYVALLASERDRALSVWVPGPPATVRLLAQFEGEIQAAGLSADGLQAAILGKDRRITLWDVGASQQVGELQALSEAPFFPDGRLQFSPDGRLLAVSTHEQIQIWDVAAHRRLHSLADPRKSICASLAFSVDGRLLAAAIANGVRLWDLTIGNEAVELRGHGDTVSCLAFSPDGKRLVTGSRDRTVRIWDRTTAQEVGILRGHTGDVRFVAFSKDGEVLVSASEDGTVRVIDARPVTPDLSDLREAAGLAAWLAGAAGSPADLAARVERYPGITEDVRVHLRGLAPRFWKLGISTRADKLAESLRKDLLLKADVLERLRTDASLSDELRAAAMQKAAESADDPWKLNSASWQIAVRPAAEPGDYRRALHWAEAAVGYEPDESAYVNTLGVAQYRNGLYAEALATLTRSHATNQKNESGPQPVDLAFLAMTYHALGETDHARSFLRELTDVCEQPRWKSQAEAAALLQEARERLGLLDR